MPGIKILVFTADAIITVGTPEIAGLKMWLQAEKVRKLSGINRVALGMTQPGRRCMSIKFKKAGDERDMSCPGCRQR